MRLRLLATFLLLALAFASPACSHRVPLSSDAAGDIHRLAVVVRVMGDAEVNLADHLPSRLTPSQVGKKITAMMTSYELGERIRSALVERLPKGPPFTELGATVQVESALGSMLAVDRTSGPPPFDDLRSLGVDGVLYVQIDHWGAVYEEPTAAFFAQGEGRLFTLDGDHTEWREPIDLRWPRAGLTGNWTADQPLRAALIFGSEKVGEQLGVALGGTAAATGGPTALDNPDVVIDTRGPEKMEAVLPFDDEVDAGPDAGPPDAGKPRKAKPVVDAGDTLFPG